MVIKLKFDLLCRLSGPEKFKMADESHVTFSRGLHKTLVTVLYFSIINVLCGARGDASFAPQSNIVADCFFSLCKFMKTSSPLEICIFLIFVSETEWVCYWISHVPTFYIGRWVVKSILGHCQLLRWHLRDDLFSSKMTKHCPCAGIVINWFIEVWLPANLFKLL